MDGWMDEGGAACQGGGAWSGAERWASAVVGVASHGIAWHHIASYCVVLRRIASYSDSPR